MEKIIYTKIDTVFIYKITPLKLFIIENDYEIFHELSKNKNMNLYFILKNNDKLSEIKISEIIKDLIITKKINNQDIIDFVFYIDSITNKNTLEHFKNFKKTEKIFEDFIIHLSKFREDQILKYTFNINQRRISRKQLLKMKEDIKSFAKVNWTTEDIFN